MNSMRLKLALIGCLLSAVPRMSASTLPFGQVTTGTISSAAQTNSYTFSANANDVFDFTLIATSGSLSPKIQLYNSDGSLINSANPYGCDGSTVELNTVTAPTSGIYTVIISDCSDTNTGNYLIYVQRTNAPTGAVAFPFGGQPQTGAITPAQSNSYTFNANANDVVDFTLAASGNLSPKIRVYNPSGALVDSANPYGCDGSTVELNTVMLAATGTYTVLVGDCSDTNSGSYQIYSQRTNNPSGAVTLLVGGQIQSGTVGSATQSDSYAFTAAAGDAFDFTLVATSGNLSPKIRLYNPSGGLVGSANPYGCDGSTVQLNSGTLPSAGIYTVLVGDCSDTNTGNYNLSAQCFGACPSSAASIPQTITFAYPGNQILGGAPFTLSATASSGLSVTFASNTTSVCTISGAAVTLVAVGTCSITASQAGDANYAAAPSITQTFAVFGPTTDPGATSSLLLISGTINGQSVSPGNATIMVAPGGAITGSFIVSVNSSWPSNDVMAMGVTPTWGQPASSFTDLGGFGSPTSNLQRTITLNLTAPTAAGTYYIVTAFRAEYTAAEVMSCTNWQVGSLNWNTGYAIADWTASTINNANSDGTVLVNYLFPSGNQPQYVPATAIQVQVLSANTGGPQITSVSQISNQETQTIVVNGSRFGTQSPYTGDSSSIKLVDGTLFSAGFVGTFQGTAENDLLTLVVNSWTDSQIVLGGFSGSWGANGWKLNNGDQVELYVWNAQTGAGPATITTTVTTQPNCFYTLAPATQVIATAGGAGSIGVLTTPGCPWIATSAASFLTVTSGSTGTGPGIVQFSATANTGSATQTGTISIGGQTATINQGGTSSLLLLNPTYTAVQWRQQSALPAPITVSVFTGASSLSYTATASSTGSWLSVSPTSGAAPGSVIVTVNPSSLQPGTYEGTVTVNAPAANPSSQLFTVSLTVVSAGSPSLSVPTTGLNYSFVQGSQQTQTQRIPVGNSGGGTLVYLATASANSGGNNWLSVTQDGAGATPSTPDMLAVNVDPSSLAVGTYTGQVVLTSGSATQTIPVTTTVTAAQQTILLSQTGLTFTAVANGGIVPAQTFGILNSGTGVMDWSVSTKTLSGGNGWLSVTPTSGSTDAGSLTVPLVIVSVNPASLTPGQYSGQIQVSSTAADDSPQFVSVILNVLPAGSNPGPIVLPTGLIFTQAVGGAAASPQTISLSNLTAAQETFSTGTLTTDGANWFTVSPATGTATPTEATTVTVSVSDTGLTPAIRQGVLTFLFQDGSVRTVNILYLLATGGVTSQSSNARPLATTASCTPTKLLPLVTSLGSQFTVPAAWPNTLATQVVDDCGNPDVSGTVVATFSNGDPPLPLISLKNGQWTNSWQVNNTSSSVIAVTVTADDPTLNISGTTSVSGSLENSATAPVMATGGILNAASYSLSAPLAPGTLVAVFGSNLANGTGSSTAFPLSSELSGALVTIGGEPAPLMFATPGQINAVVPYGLPVNTKLQVIVQQGNAYTAPQAITLAAATPAIFTTTATGSGQGIIVRPDGNIAQTATPAQAGDEIVIFAGGLGDTTPEATAGQETPLSPLMYAANPVSLTIGGQTARVDFAGLVPTLTGLYQINAAVPSGVQGNAVPVVLTVAGQPSPPVTMAVQ